jgi:hypothetical protein
MSEFPRRLALKVAVKAIILACLLLFAYILLGTLRCSSSPQGTAAPLQQRVELSPERPLQRIQWAGGNVLVLYRDPTLLAILASQDETRDLPALRAHDPSRLVVFDRAGGMNCPLEWVPPGSRQAPHQPWPGGLREICRNNWYDAAGRNLDRSRPDIAVPPYRWAEDNLLILGSGGDNPPPQP